MRRKKKRRERIYGVVVVEASRFPLLWCRTPVRTAMAMKRPMPQPHMEALVAV